MIIMLTPGHVLELVGDIYGLAFDWLLPTNHYILSYELLSL